MGDYIPLATSPTLRDEENDDQDDDWGHRLVISHRRGSVLNRQV